MNLIATLPRNPLVSSNMTHTDLIREMELTFPHPTPLIAAVLARLRGERAYSPQPGGEGVVVRSTPVHGASPLHCPACGVVLQLHKATE